MGEEGVGKMSSWVCGEEGVDTHEQPERVREREREKQIERGRETEKKKERHARLQKRLHIIPDHARRP